MESYSNSLVIPEIRMDCRAHFVIVATWLYKERHIAWKDYTIDVDQFTYVK